jgi:hypothetical protein
MRSQIGETAMREELKRQVADSPARRAIEIGSTA